METLDEVMAGSVPPDQLPAKSFDHWFEISRAWIASATLHQRPCGYGWAPNRRLKMSAFFTISDCY